MSRQEIVTCDVAGCGKTLSDGKGSTFTLEVKSVPHWTAPGVLHADLCEEHLAAVLGDIEDCGLKLDVDV